MVIFHLFNQIATVNNSRTNILLTTITVGYFIKSFHVVFVLAPFWFRWLECVDFIWTVSQCVFIVNNLTACENNCLDDLCIVQSAVEMNAKFHLCVDICLQTCNFITISHFGSNATATVQTSWIELSFDYISIETKTCKHSDQLMK